MPRAFHQFLDLGVEDQMTAELEIRRRQARAQVNGLNLGMAQRLANLSFTHSTLSPGVLAAAAMAGLEADTPALKVLEKRALRQSVAQRDALAQEPRRGWDWAWDLGSAVWEQGIKGTVRVATTALDALYKEGAVGTASFIEGLGQGLPAGEAARRSYGYSPGALALASALQGRPVNLGTGLTFDQSEMTPELTEALAAVGGMGALKDLSPGQAEEIRNLARSPEQLELGLPAWLYSELTRQTEGVRVGATATQPGRPVTPGRLFAGGAATTARMIGLDILEPGSDSYNVVSGIGDFGSNIFLDPGAGLLKLSGAFRAANAALVPDAVRPTVFQRSASEWLNSPHGQSVTRYLTDNTDFQTSYGLLRHTTGGRRADPRLAAALTESNSPTITARILNDAIQGGTLTQVPGRQSLAGRAISTVTRAPVGTVTGTLGGPLLGQARASRLAGIGVGLERRAHDSFLGRWAMSLHQGMIDPHNVPAAVEDFGAFMRLAQFDHDDVSRFMHDMARIPDGGYDEMYQVYFGAMQRWESRLAQAGIAPEKVRAITNTFAEWEDMRKYWTNLAGDPEYIPGGRITYRRSGEIDVMPQAMLFSEMLNRSIPLPNPTKVREAMRRVKLSEWTSPRVSAALLGSKPADAARWAANAGSWLMSQAFKPLVLFRIAYPVRVVAEEQIRMAAAGFDSFIRHPLSALAWTMGREGGLTDNLLSAHVEHRAAMTRGRTYEALIGAPHQRRRIGSSEYMTFLKNQDPQHLSGWTGELSQLWHDELASEIARAVFPRLDDIPTPGPVAGALGAGPPGLPQTGATMGPVPAIPRQDPNVLFSGPQILDDVKARFWDGDLAPLRRRFVDEEARAGLADRAVADAYIEAVWARINSKTGGRYMNFAPARGGWVDDIGERHDLPTPAGARDTYVITQPGDPRLIRAIGEGRLDDLDLVDADEITYGRIQEHLRANYYDAAPDKVKGPRPVHFRPGDAYDKAIRAVFQVLMGAATDTLSRSPHFRQVFWQRAGQLYPLADAPTRAAILARADELGIPRRALGIAPRRARAAGETAVFDSLEQVELFAKSAALEETQRLLYDLSRRRNFFDMTRLIFPFGEAWNEIVSTWSRLLVKNPEILRRASQGVTGARASGFFYSDPQTGEEVFNYPGSEMFADFMFDQHEADEGFGQGARTIIERAGRAITGESEEASIAQFTGRASGLNLAFGSIGPGFGPFVSYPAAQMDWLTNDPGWRWLRDWVFPFGEPEADTPGEALDSIMPAWIKRGLQALGRPQGRDQNVYNNTIIDVQRAMRLNGEWKDTTPAEYQASRRVAEQRARQLFAIRTVSAFIGPTPAGVRWDIELDPDGRVYALQVLAAEYAKLRQAADGDDVAAFDTFVQRFGIDPLVIAEPKSQSVVVRSTQEAGLDFQATHKKTFEDFPLTAYFAQPDDPSGEGFDYASFLAQFKEDVAGFGPARVPVSPAQWNDQYQRAAGGMLYERARQAVGPNPDDAQRAWLRMVREQIRELYPGFGGDTIGLPQPATQQQMIDELAKWQDDPFLRNTETGIALDLYFTARDNAIAEAANRGVVGWSSAESTEDLRVWLQGVAQLLIMDYPDFLAVYDRVLSGEVEGGDTPIIRTLAGIDLTSE